MNTGHPRWAEPDLPFEMPSLSQGSSRRAPGKGSSMLRLDLRQSAVMLEFYESSRLLDATSAAVLESTEFLECDGMILVLTWFPCCG